MASELQAAADVLGCDIIAEAGGETIGMFLSAMLGGRPRQDGPPYEHRHALPETEEEMAAAPLLPTMDMVRDR
jgi:hypothetical protein